MQGTGTQADPYIPENWGEFVTAVGKSGVYVSLPLEKPSGAFMNAVDLEYVHIPRSCKKIGEWAFTNTKLRRVRISEDCEYYPTSFPKGCEIEFYGGGGEFGQLLDSDNFALIDSEGAKIYVKE